MCLVTQLCPAFCDPLHYSLPSSSVHGIIQTRTLEWVAMPSSRESSWPRDPTRISCFLNCRRILYLLSHRGSTNNLTILSTTLPCAPTLPLFWFKCKHFWTLLSIFCSLYIALCFILSQASSDCFYPSKKKNLCCSLWNWAEQWNKNSYILNPFKYVSSDS